MCPLYVQKINKLPLRPPSLGASLTQEKAGPEVAHGGPNANAATAWAVPRRSPGVPGPCGHLPPHVSGQRPTGSLKGNSAGAATGAAGLKAVQWPSRAAKHP